jgi:heat shock protein HspQ
MQSSILDLIKEKPQDNQSEKEKLKEAKLEETIQQLLNNLSSANVNTLRDKVAWILNHNPKARDSDVTLMLDFWSTFESHIYNGQVITPDDLYSLTRMTSIARERAKIQNVYKLFQASTEVREHRGTLSEEEKEKAVEDKPVGHPSMSVYMDESGKNAEQLIVGSVWFLEVGKALYDIHKKIADLKKEMDFKKEFHFAKMSREELPIYKRMIKVFLHESPTHSFKVISIPVKGIQNKQEALRQLFYHLIVKGIENESQTGRAVLPRAIQIWKDAEEEGVDRLLVAELTDRLKQASANLFNRNLHLEYIRCVDSEPNLFLQVTDLFTASANRIINEPAIVRNHKTEFAEFFLDSVGIDKSFTPNERLGDNVVHISL